VHAASGHRVRSRRGRAVAADQGRSGGLMARAPSPPSLAALASPAQTVPAGFAGSWTFPPLTAAGPASNEPGSGGLLGSA
jgi:hypothetical protein